MQEKLKKLVDLAAKVNTAILISPSGDGIGYNIDQGQATTPEKACYVDVEWLGHGATLEEAIDEALKTFNLKGTS